MLNELSEEYLKRFGGIARLYGKESLRHFARAHFCIVGIGGVGTWIAESFARTGIGEITLIDLDEICVTNTNRQIHALTSTVGQSKIDVMARRILEINPECKVHKIEDFITVQNIQSHLSQEFDYIIDAIDSVKTKAAIAAYCRRNKKKFLMIGGAGGQIDPTLIEVADIAKTVQDPLVSKVRSLLKSQYGVKLNNKGKFGIDTVYSKEQLRYPSVEGEICFAKKQTEGQLKMDCSSGFGAVTMVTASFGLVAAAHVIKKFLASKNHR
ncbi:tRNA cyclic N6-threonylcarbamoyladenosine(37) synthase TcdA [Thorsellia kenyensis]|uniref:tRNA cyclic N6-threonylcarbamoyladenosine(37) synthase TcdA n=1 Tax=Thorsellia kenyensis TaxID=1549888 RepID=A0ABV6CCF5_9GAMM